MRALSVPARSFAVLAVSVCRLGPGGGGPQAAASASPAPEREREAAQAPPWPREPEAWEGAAAAKSGRVVATRGQ